MEELNKQKRSSKVLEDNIINPLRAGKVTVRFVPHKGGPAGDNPNHALSGGMAEGSTVKYCVPILSSGTYKNVLTNSEKDFLEKILDLDPNALSVYRKIDNYWDNYYVTVGKDGITLDLSNPEDYIKYKVLLANSDEIAPSLENLQDRPKQTYRFVMVEEGDEARLENDKMDATMASYAEFKKISSDNDTMRILVELIDLRPYAQNTKSDFLRSRINQLIQADPKGFLKNITDPYLHSKVLIRRATELGALFVRNDCYHLKADGTSLSDLGQDATLSVASRWLNMPSHQDIKAILEATVDKARK